MTEPLLPHRRCKKCNRIELSYEKMMEHLILCMNKTREEVLKDRIRTQIDYVYGDGKTHDTVVL